MEYTYKYPRPAVTADCVVMTKESEPKVLLIQRGFDPYKDCWAFPGGFMNMDETTEECAIRELEEETGLVVSDLKQIGTYSKVDRDPRGRTITVAYLIIVDAPLAVVGQDDAARAEWWPLSDLPHLAFDHEEILKDARDLFEKSKQDSKAGSRSILGLGSLLVLILAVWMFSSCSNNKKEVDSVTSSEMVTSPYIENQPTYYNTTAAEDSIMNVQQNTVQPATESEPPTTIHISRYYEKGYDNGYDDGEDDAVSGNGWGGQFDDECHYRGWERQEYQRGYEEGYEAGYYDNKDSEE